MLSVATGVERERHSPEIVEISINDVLEAEVTFEERSKY